MEKKSELLEMQKQKKIRKFLPDNSKPKMMPLFNV